MDKPDVAWFHFQRLDALLERHAERVYFCGVLDRFPRLHVGRVQRDGLAGHLAHMQHHAAAGAGRVIAITAERRIAHPRVALTTGKRLAGDL